jgi:hypothetical protein
MRNWIIFVLQTNSPVYDIKKKGKLDRQINGFYL